TWPCTPCTVNVPVRLPRRPTRNRSPSFAVEDGSPVMHQSMRSPRWRNTSATRRTPSIASPSSSEVSSSASRPACPGRAATKRSAATTNAATLPFMSAAPRPYSTPSRISGTNGSLDHASRGPVGTTSVWPSRTSVGASSTRLPCVAQRFSTAPKRRCSQWKPAAPRRPAMSAWQPAASGVTDGRAMRSRVRSRTSDMRGDYLSPAGATAGRPGSTNPEALLERVVAEALGHRTIVCDDHRPAGQLRVLAQQQLPLRVAAWRLAVIRQLPPGGRGLVGHGVPAAQGLLPSDQLFGRAGLVPVIHEAVLDTEPVQPL